MCKCLENEMCPQCPAPSPEYLNQSIQGKHSLVKFESADNGMILVIRDHKEGTRHTVRSAYALPYMAQAMWEEAISKGGVICTQ